MSAMPSLTDPALVADPYPFYERLRAEGPVHWDAATANGCWLVTRHADVSLACRDPRLSSNRAFAYRFFLPEDDDGRRLGDAVEGFLAFKDPPAHTRLRALVNKAFTPRALEAIRPRIAELVDTLIDAAVQGGKLRLIRDFAYPLPVTVMRLAKAPSAPRSDRRSPSERPR